VAAGATRRWPAAQRCSAFSVTSATAARYLIASTAAGTDAFFADAGEPIERAALPEEPPGFDRDRLLAAFDKHGATHYDFPVEEAHAAR
jgi:hypothetical protein